MVTAKRTIPCALVLWGIGMRPDTDLARSCSVETAPSGAICVDDHMRTNMPDLYACGDCVQTQDILGGVPGAYLFWEPAQRGGAAAGVNAAGGECVFGGTAPLFLTNKGCLSILAMGKTEEQLAGGKGIVLEEERKGVYRRLLFEDGRLAGAQMVGTLRDADLFFAQIRKNALRREDVWDLTESVPDLDRITLQEAVFFLRKQRRTAYAK